MIDVDLLRENPDRLRKSTEDKQVDSKVVDEALKLDEDWREALKAVEKLRHEKNVLSDDPSSENIKKAKKVKEDLKKLEDDLKSLEEKRDEALRKIPNPALEDVPVGKGEDDNKVERKWQESTTFDFEPKDHLELGETLGLIDTKSAAKVSGARFAYLKGDAVLLEFALVNFAMEVLSKEGFEPVVPPAIVRKSSMESMGFMEHGGDEDVFILEKDELVLIGTSEQSIGPMHKDETFDIKDLPRRYVGFSPCFRREAGSYGKDTRGIFRLHQFDKIEMFSFAHPDKSEEEHGYLLKLQEELYQALEIPYQVVKLCTGDLAAPAARTYDLEAWIPSQEKYREVTSTSTTTDFQARRLNTKYQEGGDTEYVHMLNGTAFAIGRTIIAILENYQQEDGSVLIPNVLQKYMGKEKIIEVPQKG